MQSTVLHNQNLLDIAIQENGSVQTVFELALLNGMSITDNIQPQQNVIVAKSNLIIPEIVNYLTTKQHIVATGGVESLEIRPTGIGFMIIQNDFIIG